MSRLLKATALVTALFAASLLPSHARAYDHQASLLCLQVARAKLAAFSEIRTQVAEHLLTLGVPERIESPLNGWLVATAFLSPGIAAELRACSEAAAAAPPYSGLDVASFFDSVEVVPPDGFLFDFHPLSDVLNTLVLDDVRVLSDPKAPPEAKALVIASYLPWGSGAKLSGIGARAMNRLSKPVVNELKKLPPGLTAQGREALVERLKKSRRIRRAMPKRFQVNVTVSNSRKFYPPRSPPQQVTDASRAVLSEKEQRIADLYLKDGYPVTARKRGSDARFADAQVGYLRNEFKTLESPNPSAETVFRNIKKSVRPPKGSPDAPGQARIFTVDGRDVNLSKKEAQAALRRIGKTSLKNKVDVVRIVGNDYDITGVFRPYSTARRRR